MSEHGWCPSDINRLLSSLGLRGLLYASLMGPPEYTSSVQAFNNKGAFNIMASDQSTREVQLPNQKANRHDGCSGTVCHAYDCDEQTYKPKHFSRTGACVEVKLDVWEALEMLANDVIPVVVYEDGEARFVPASANAPYAAISHVWSDGLGNPKVNTFPLCQLKRIASLVNKLFPASEHPVPLWIDTLCCPVAVEPFETRSRAINLMKKTYQEASTVLVLDAYLESKSVSHLAPAEILMLIHCSKWNRRLWTLHEKFMASEIVLQFRDRALSMEDILEHYTFDSDASDNGRLKAPWNIEHSRITASSFGLLRGAVEDAWRKRLPPRSMLQGLEVQLQYGMTSKSSDEAICIGNILDLDTRSILSARKERRMEVLWTLMPHIPSDVIYWSLPTLEKKGFRWAPSSFLNCRHDLYQQSGFQNGQLNPRGLLVRYPGRQLGCPRDLKLTRQFRMVDACDTIYLVSY